MVDHEPHVAVQLLLYSTGAAPLSEVRAYTFSNMLWGVE